jgi:Ion channel
MLLFVFGLVLIVLTLVDAFVTIVLPRSIQRQWSISTTYFNWSWSLYHPLMVRLPEGKLRRRLLVVYAPLSVILLIALWAALLVLGFGCMFDGLHLPCRSISPATLGDYLYFSGVTFFTLGYGDMTPSTGLGRFCAVAEAATGFGFLAIVIGYVPVLYGAVSRREIGIVMLDSKAGSSPTACELLCRYANAGVLPDLKELLHDWEHEAAEMLESFLAYPMVSYYRSQHDEQSWLQSTTAIMDACVLIDAYLPSEEAWQRSLRFQAKATFALARHVIVDLAYIIGQPPLEKQPLRLAPAAKGEMMSRLRAAGFPTQEDDGADSRFQELRSLYEPFVAAMAKDMLLTLPEWIDWNPGLDNWQTSAWDGPKHF